MNVWIQPGFSPHHNPADALRLESRTVLDRYIRDEGGRGIQPLIALRMEPWRSDEVVRRCGTICDWWAAQRPDAPRGLQIQHDASTFLCVEPFHFAPSIVGWTRQHVNGEYANERPQWGLYWLDRTLGERTMTPPDFVHSLFEGSQVYAVDWRRDDEFWCNIRELCLAAEGSAGKKMLAEGFPPACVGEVGYEKLRRLASAPADSGGGAYHPLVVAFNVYVLNWEARGVASMDAGTDWMKRGTRWCMEHAARLTQTVRNPHRSGYYAERLVPDGVTSHLYAYEHAEIWHKAFDEFFGQLIGKAVVHINAGVEGNRVIMPDVEWKREWMIRHREKISDVIVYMAAPHASDPLSTDLWQAYSGRIVNAALAAAGE